MTFDLTKTYEQLVVERLDEIKAMAATYETYGDWFRLEEEIKEERDHLRKAIRQSRTEVRRYERWIEQDARFQRRRTCVPLTGPPIKTDCIYDRWLARSRRRLEFECRIRDELTEALREHRRQDRADQVAFAKIRKELENRLNA